MATTTPLKAALFLAGGTAAAATVSYFAGVIDPLLPQPPAAVSTAPTAPPSEADAKDARLEEPAPPADGQAVPPAEAAGPVMPTFDVVRVEANGSIVIAGKSAPVALVEILSNQTDVIGSTTASPEGDFAIVFETPLAPGDYQLSLRATTPDNVVALSAETAVVSIPETPDGEVLAMVEEPGKPAELISVPQPKAEPPPAAEAPPAAAPPAAEAEPPPAAQPEPPADIAAVEPPPPMTAQPEQPPQAVPAINLAVEAIEIEGRKIFVAGAADPGRRVRAYANELLIGDALTSPGGRFLVEADMDLPVGEYMVRIDALAEDGVTVVARAVVPFEREPGESIAAVAPPATENPPAGAPPAAAEAPPPAAEEEIAMAQPPADPVPPKADAAELLPPASEPVDPPAAEAAPPAVAGEKPPAADAAESPVAEAPPAVSVPPAVAEAPADPVPPKGDTAELQQPPAADPANPPVADAAPPAVAVETPPVADAAEPPVAEAPPADSVPPAVVEGPADPVPPKGDAAALPPAAEPANPPAAVTPADPAAPVEGVVATAEPPAAPVPEVVAPKLQPANTAVIIRRGDTLWRISRRVYGKGMRYSTIYLANRTQIEDPNRIWPGQVMKMPGKSADGVEADWSRIEKRLTTVEEAEAKLKAEEQR